MLRLSASHLKTIRASGPNERLVWVDIGGGTGQSVIISVTYSLPRTPGWNIEEMHKYFPITSFDAVYLIDLCEPLLKVARKRFQEKGWNNVVVLCQDASNFTLPEWNDQSTSKGSLSLVTMSYSLSMASYLKSQPQTVLIFYLSTDPRLLHLA
jgi:betaine lipid synthase